MRWVLVTSVARKNAASEDASTSALNATVALPVASEVTVARRANTELSGFGATVPPKVKTSNNTSRLASTAPLASFNMIDALPISPAQSVAAVLAGLFSEEHTEPTALFTVIRGVVMVAGTTVTVTTEVAPALSVKVKVTIVLANTFFGVIDSVAPVTCAGTAMVLASLDRTL